MLATGLLACQGGIKKNDGQPRLIPIIILYTLIVIKSFKINPKGCQKENG